MDRFPRDPEARDSKLQRVIAARTEAIRRDIKLRRKDVIQEIDNRLSYEPGFLATLIRVTTLNGNAGLAFAETEIGKAIHAYATELAERDMVEMDRARKESHDDNRIAQVELARALH
jgi:sulfate adenylyltransferase subunit 1 (EFTu-like GTPase family)